MSFNTLTITSTQLLSIGVLLIRLTVGLVLAGAGAGKVLGWFGGYGMDVTLDFYSRIGFSAPLAYLSMYTEFIGGFLLAIGLFTRPAAFAIMINMLVAFIVTLPNGFYEGAASYSFTLFICAVAVMFTGPMMYSLDAGMFRK